jgi:hypothetical protein
MSVENWKKDETGNVIVRPVVSYELMIAAGVAIAVRLEYANPGDKLQKPTGNLQAVLTPTQAEQLGRALLKTAETIANQPPTGPKS